MSLLKSVAARWAPPLAWICLICFLSSRPVLPGPSIPFADKVMHAFEFGVLAFLLDRALLPRLRRRAFALRWGTIVAICLVCGILDEMHQAFVPGRNCEFPDVVADFSGALLAGLRAPRRRHSRQPPGGLRSQI